jgi:hypothetical protein
MAPGTAAATCTRPAADGGGVVAEGDGGESGTRRARGVAAMFFVPKDAAPAVPSPANEAK